jgi:ribonuclease HI
MSQSYQQQAGVPQGSVLSVTLFAISINSVVKTIDPAGPVKCSLYVDDFIIYIRGRFLPSLHRKLMECVDKLHQWSLHTGFQFSPQKTKVIDFCRLRSLESIDDIKMDGQYLPKVDTLRLLGLLFDSKLSWRPHLEDLKRRSHQALNILRVISRKSWGADRKTMLQLYGALVRSKLDYGCMVYNSARPSYIRILDPIQNCGLRLAMGAFRSSPALSLYAESGELPLWSRRNLLTCNYIASLRGKPDHTTYDCVFKPQHQQKYENCSRATRPVAIRAKEFCERMEIAAPQIYRIGPMVVPPWLIPRPNINMTLTNNKKAETDAQLYKTLYLEQVDRYPGFTLLFTDGSKKDNDVGCAFVTGNVEKGFCLDGANSVFSSEMFALWKALEWCEQHRRNTLLCTDSLSSLMSIGSLYPTNPIAQNIQTCLYRLREQQIKIVFLWIPSHIGIAGNEKADTAAKRASESLRIDCLQATSEDFRTSLRTANRDDWGTVWLNEDNNKLRQIKKYPRKWATSFHKNRRDEVVLARLRIGHSKLTHSYLMSGEPAPTCQECGAPLTVKHIIEDCVHYQAARKRFKIKGTLKEDLGDDPTSTYNVLQFLQYLNLYGDI